MLTKDKNDDKLKSNDTSIERMNTLHGEVRVNIPT